MFAHLIDRSSCETGSITKDEYLLFDDSKSQVDSWSDWLGGAGDLMHPMVLGGSLHQ